MTTLIQINGVIANNPEIFDDLTEKHKKAFMSWLPDSVHVVQAFLTYAKELKWHGKREYYSAYCIRERIRWDSMIKENGTEYKISNNITPFVARLVMAMDNNLKGMFKTKVVRHA